MEQLTPTPRFDEVYQEGSRIMEQPHVYTLICKKCLKPYDGNVPSSQEWCSDCLKRKSKIFCPVCKVKHITGTHIKVCKEQHRWKWFWHNLRRR